MQHALDQKVRQSQRRSFQYWYSDGFSEIAVGLFFWLLAAYLALAAGVTVTSWWRIPFALALPALVVVGVFGTRWLVRTLKARYTYARTGYVSFPQEPSTSHRRWRVAIIAVIGAGVGVFFASRSASLAWIPAVQGFAVGVILFLIAVRVHLLRFYVLAVLAVLLGVGIGLRVEDPNWGNALFYAGMGLTLVVSGLWALVGYLRETTPPEAS